MVRIFAIIGFCIAALPGAASAQDSCTTRPEVGSYLLNEFSESPVALGVANNGSLIEVFASHDRTTWTIMLTQPDGTSCLVAAGQAWENLPQVVPTAVDPGT